MDAISQTIFSNAFSWIEMFEFRLKFQWSLFLGFQLTIFQRWFRYWLGAEQATSHYLNQWWLDYRCICVNELMCHWSITHIVIRTPKSIITAPADVLIPFELYHQGSLHKIYFLWNLIRYQWFRVTYLARNYYIIRNGRRDLAKYRGISRVNGHMEINTCLCRVNRSMYWTIVP